MSAAVLSAATSTDLEDGMRALGRAARAAQRAAGLATSQVKRTALLAMSAEIAAAEGAILAANARDLEAARAKGQTAAFLDRLTLDPARVAAMARGVAEIAALRDPVGRTLAAWDRPNGLRIERVATPLGVVGVIFESRPNVAADAGALCLAAGNAAILRGGSESQHSVAAIHRALAAGLGAAGLPEAAIQIVPTTDRAAVGMMLKGLGGTIDVIVPRGGKSLVARVQDEARVPVFSHLDGICHVYVHAAADPDTAERIVVNAKMRRTGVCGAAETLLVDRAAPEGLLARLVGALIAAGCEVRGDAATRAAVVQAVAARAEDYGHEFLDAVIAVKVVDGLEAAMAHIAAHGSQHTESIVTQDDAAARRFLAEVDSAIVMVNASTQFADGGEFGMGAEIGIATGRLHARGPVGVEQLTSFKYRVHGTGQIRP